jgi:G3E family GTPase
VESQVQNAHIVLLNKCDKVNKTTAMVTRSALSAINPEVSVLMAEYGAVDWADYHHALSTAPSSKRIFIEYEADAVSEGHLHSHVVEDALGYESYGRVLGDLSFDRSALEAFFQAMNDPTSGIGEIVRAKGFFRLGDRTMLMELASGDFSFQPVGPVKESKISIIGRSLNREMIGAALERCVGE